MIVPNCQIDAVYKIQNIYDVIWGLTPTCSGAHEAIERDRQRHLPRCLYVRKQKSCLSHDLDLSILIIESGGNPSNHCTTIRQLAHQMANLRWLPACWLGSHSSLVDYLTPTKKLKHMVKYNQNAAPQRKLIFIFIRILIPKLTSGFIIQRVNP